MVFILVVVNNPVPGYSRIPGPINKVPVDVARGLQIVLETPRYDPLNDPFMSGLLRPLDIGLALGRTPCVV